ncbi:MAG: helix-turn-helix transcriptional regulator [Kiritimatiellae bacterium]|nr:helix-turn-helix transcriptional regulator [Kiritimatiellia bacterium]
MNAPFHVGYLRVNPGWRAGLGFHRHQHVEAMVVVRGRLRVALEDSEVVAEGGDGLCYAPGLAHEEHAEGRPCTEFVFFKGEVETGTLRSPLVKSGNTRMRTLARWLIEERNTHDHGRERRMRTLARAVLHEMARQSAGTQASPIQRVREYMRTRLKEPHALEDLARLAGMSKYHFVRTYKRMTGMPPMADLQRIRIEAACDRLLTTQLPLKTVAEQTGFCDVYYFSRVFKARYGVPPGTFRR